MKKSIIFSLLILHIMCITAQTSPFIGAWYGSISDAKGNKIWDIKLNITSTTAAELFLFKTETGTYVSYLTDPASASYTKNVTFNANGNQASLIVVYKNSETAGQSVYNLAYRTDLKEIYAVWSDISTKLATSELGATVASGKFEKGQSYTYTAENIVVGAQSMTYITIDKIKVSANYTDVTFDISNNTANTISGTFHEPGHSTAMRITDVNRLKSYALTGATNATLPYSFDLEPGYRLNITLRFDPIPFDLKSLNILEGQEVKKSVWNFYDVTLK